MAASMLCDDPLFGGESLFGGMSLDLEDLFSDDMMGALLAPGGTEHSASELLVAPPPCMVPAARVTQPCSSGSGSGTAPAANSPSPTHSRSLSTTSNESQQGSLGEPMVRLVRQRSTGPPKRSLQSSGALGGSWAAARAHPTSACVACPVSRTCPVHTHCHV